MMALGGGMLQIGHVYGDDCCIFQIRKDYYEEKVTAGPQSKILEGLSWDEAAKLKVPGHRKWF